MQYMTKEAHCLWEACGEGIHYRAKVTNHPDRHNSDVNTARLLKADAGRKNLYT